MRLALEIIFLVSALGMAHTYFIYPAFMLLAGSKKRDTRYNSTDFPAIAIICAAYNEEKVIAEKIHSTFKTDYPSEKITLTIGTDHCSDRTVEIIKQLQSQYSGLKLVEFTSRTGKIGIINELCSRATAPVLVMTDANVYFEQETLPKLVRAFADARVGMVCARIVKRALNAGGVTQTELQYMNLENRLKLAESNLFKIVMGAEGGCYAMRRELLAPIPPRFIADDFFATCLVLQQKKQIIFAEDARAHEDLAADSKGEFRRKARIATGNFQNLFYFSGLLFRFSAVSFAFLSHKVLRWITPLLFILNLTAAALLFQAHVFFRAVVATELFVLFVPLLLTAAGLRFRAVTALAHFARMNAALAVGFFRYVKGVKNSVWEPVKR